MTAQDTGTTVISATTWRQIWRTPVAFWAGLGAVALILQAWVLGRWIADGGLRPGLDVEYTISPARAAVTWGAQALLLLAVVLVAVTLWREYRRTRTVTFSVAIGIGALLSFWLLPLMNYDQLFLVANRHALHVSSWGPYLPGWNAPHPELAIEQVIGSGVLCNFLMLLWYWFPMRLIQPIARRLPRWGLIRLLPITFLGALFAAVILEIAWQRSGLYSYANAPQSLSLFGGHWYQIPFYGLFIAVAVISLPMVTMMLHAQRHNTTVHIFRGSELASPQVNRWVRLLAGIGFANVLILISVLAAPHGPFGADPMPADTPSYLWPPMGN